MVTNDLALIAIGFINTLNNINFVGSVRREKQRGEETMQNFVKFRNILFLLNFILIFSFSGTLFTIYPGLPVVQSPGQASDSNREIVLKNCLPHENLVRFSTLLLKFLWKIKNCLRSFQYYIRKIHFSSMNEFCLYFHLEIYKNN